MDLTSIHTVSRSGGSYISTYRQHKWWILHQYLPLAQVVDLTSVPTISTGGGSYIQCKPWECLARCCYKKHLQIVCLGCEQNITSIGVTSFFDLCKIKCLNITNIKLFNYLFWFQVSSLKLPMLFIYTPAMLQKLLEIYEIINWNAVLHHICYQKRKVKNIKKFIISCPRHQKAFSKVWISFKCS